MVLVGALGTAGWISAQVLEPVPEVAFEGAPALPAESLIQQEQDGAILGPADDSEFIGPNDAAAGVAGGTPFSLSGTLNDFADGFFDLGPPGDPSGRDRFRLTLGLRGGYDDNVLFAATDPIGSLTSAVDARLVYNFGAERLRLSLQIAGGATYYDNRPGDTTDTNGEFVFTLAYQWTRRLEVTFDARVAYLSQPDPQLVGGVSRFSGDYYYTNTALNIAYRLRPLVGVNFGYQFAGFRYTEAAINEAQGYYQQNFTLGLDYLLLPRTTLTLQYRFNPVTYYEADLGSVGNILLLGFQQAFTPRLDWTFQAGVEQRRLTNPGVEGPSEYFGPFVETALSYGFGPASEVNASIRFGTEPSGVSGLAIRQTLRGSLSVRHAFTGRLIADVGLSYENDNYDQPGEASDFAQQVYSAYTGLRFQFNPVFAVTGRYDYTTVQSDFETDEYTRGVVSLGLELIF